MAFFTGCLALLFTFSSSAGNDLSYELNVSVDYEAGTFSGDMVVRFTNSSSARHSELFFRLFANDPSIYGNAQVRVDQVSIQTQSVPVAMFIDDTALMVALPQPLSPGDSVEIAMGFAGRASFWPEGNAYGNSDTGYGILTRSGSALVLTAFYPTLAVYSSDGWALDPSVGFGDALMGDAADYDVKVTVSDVPTLAGTGQLVGIVEDSGTRTYEFRAQGARDFSLVLFENYVAAESTTGEITLRSWFSSQHQSAGIYADEMSMASLLLLEKMVGPAPFREFEFVEVPLRNAAGVEFSGLVLVSSEYSARPEDLFFSIIVAHEMAHQWFYAAVGNDVSEHPWLDEGLATYLSYEVLSSVFGPVTAQGQFDQSASTYSAAQQQAAHLSVGSPRYAFPNSSTYSAFVYSGGATFLNELRRRLGDEAFYRGLQTYYRDGWGRVVTPVDLIAAFEMSCSCQFEDLLRTYGLGP